MSATTSLKIETRHEELDRVAAAVEEMAEREGWPPELGYRVTLVVEELVVNVVNHGHDGGVHDIEITLVSEPDALTIEITDDGRPFDPLNDAPEPDLDSLLEDRPVGGLGIHLVRTMMDEMHYRREQNRNHTTLIARRGE